MDIDKITSDIDRSTAALLIDLRGFPDERFNESPDDNSWSAAQIVEHLTITEILVNQLLVGETGPTDHRDAEQKIEVIRSYFLDFNQKFTAQDFIRPSTERKEKDKLILAVRACRQKLKDAAATLDLTATCFGYKHPGFGMLTRIEWIYFNLIHSERHRHQMAGLLS